MRDDENRIVLRNRRWDGFLSGLLLGGRLCRSRLLRRDLRFGEGRQRWNGQEANKNQNGNAHSHHPQRAARSVKKFRRPSYSVGGRRARQS